MLSCVCAAPGANSARSTRLVPDPNFDAELNFDLIARVAVFQHQAHFDVLPDVLFRGVVEQPPRYEIDDLAVGDGLESSRRRADIRLGCGLCFWTLPLRSF